MESLGEEKEEEGRHSASQPHAKCLNMNMNLLHCLHGGFFLLHFFREIRREPICEREALSLFSGSGFLEGEQEEWGLL